MAIEFTQGENPTLSLTAKSNGVAVDISGATFETHFLKDDNHTELTIGNAAHSIVVAANGTFTVALTAAETVQISTGSEKTFYTKITIAGNIMIFWGRKSLTVFPSEIRKQ